MIGLLRISSVLLTVAVVTPPLAVLQYLAVKAGRFDRAIPRLWHGMVLRLLGMRVHVLGRMADERPLLLASNHISWTDIMVLGAVGDVNFIAKSEVSGWPGISILAYLQRSVFVERDRRRKSGDQAGEIAARMRRGDAMVLFAEGSTGDGNLLLPFKSTLFGAAALAAQADGAPVIVQPVVIAYTRFHGMPMNRQHRTVASWTGDTSLVPHLFALMREGAVDVEVRFGEPLAYDARTNRKALAREVERRARDMFVDALRAPRGGR